MFRFWSALKTKDVGLILILVGTEEIVDIEMQSVCKVLVLYSEVLF